MYWKQHTNESVKEFYRRTRHNIVSKTKYKDLQKKELNIKVIRKVCFGLLPELKRMLYKNPTVRQKSLRGLLSYLDQQKTKSPEYLTQNKEGVSTAQVSFVDLKQIQIGDPNKLNTVKCFRCHIEGHSSKYCTRPKAPRHFRSRKLRKHLQNKYPGCSLCVSGCVTCKSPDILELIRKEFKECILSLKTATSGQQNNVCNQTTNESVNVNETGCSIVSVNWDCNSMNINNDCSLCVRGCVSCKGPRTLQELQNSLLSGTLRLYQKAACDEEWVSLKCPAGTTISIQLAQYGKTAPLPTLCLSNPSIHPDLMDVVDPTNNFTCQWPAAVQTVVGLCQKKASCKFQTSPRTFGGDPCPGSRKFVEVVYKCRPSEFRSVIGCEDEVIQLSCNKNSRLAIYSANYGRTEYESVQCPQPSGVHEETCLSSYATETVMQMCHGKRRCALGADQATFGSPCKPDSRMYLKVIHTCVPRKVLKEKYQGEPEPDEMFEEESEDESGDSVGGVLEQPSIYSPDHSKSWSNTKLQTTQSTLIASSLPTSEGSGSGARGGFEERDGKSEPVLNLNAQSESETKGNLSSQSAHDVRIIYLISQGIHAYDFISKNSDKFYLYLAISITSVLLLLVLLILLKICIQRRRQRRIESSTSTVKKGETSSSSMGPLVPSSGLSDIDELSIITEPNEYIDLPSILRRPPEDVPLPFATHNMNMNMSTLGRNSNGNSRNPDGQVVRFSNSRMATLSRQESDTNPRSFNRELENVHFYYG